jgi:hypothetical protein
MRQIKLMALMAFIPGIFSIVPAFMTARAIRRDRVDIRGAVTRISRLEDLYYKDILGSISIEGIKEADTQHDLADVEITDETKFFLVIDGERKPASFADVKLGQSIEAKFTKPASERKPDRPDCYTVPCGPSGVVSSAGAPVRATAAEISILKP